MRYELTDRERAAITSMLPRVMTFRSARRRHELGPDASRGHRGQDHAGAEEHEKLKVCLGCRSTSFGEGSAMLAKT